MKNEAGKTVTKENAYEVWETPDGSWKWYVLKKYQAPHKEAGNEFARWHCIVESPFTPNGERGDVYIRDIKSNAVRTK